MSDEIIVGASKKAAGTVADVLLEIAKTKPELAILGGVSFLCVAGLVYVTVRLSDNQTAQNVVLSKEELMKREELMKMFNKLM